MPRIKKKERDKLSQTAIRRCSSECYFFDKGGKGCEFYQQGKVQHGDPCEYDLVNLKRYSDAFASGQTEIIKEDAAEFTAMVMMQIRRMLEQVNREGVTVQEPICNARGDPIWIPDPAHMPVPGEPQRMIPCMRIKDHPLIARVIQIARSIGISLSEFKLTPKSADEKREVSGHIIADDARPIEDILKDRKEVDDRFVKAIELGTKMTKENPIYLKLLQDGDIVE